MQVREQRWWHICVRSCCRNIQRCNHSISAMLAVTKRCGIFYHWITWKTPQCCSLCCIFGKWSNSLFYSGEWITTSWHPAIDNIDQLLWNDEKYSIRCKKEKEIWPNVLIFRWSLHHPTLDRLKAQYINVEDGLKRKWAASTMRSVPKK